MYTKNKIGPSTDPCGTPLMGVNNANLIPVLIEKVAVTMACVYAASTLNHAAIRHSPLPITLLSTISVTVCGSNTIHSVLVYSVDI